MSCKRSEGGGPNCVLAHPFPSFPPPNIQIEVFSRSLGNSNWITYLSWNIWAAWYYDQAVNSSGLICFQSPLLRQSYCFHKILGYFLKHRVLFPSCSNCWDTVVTTILHSESNKGNEKNWRRPILQNVFMFRGTRRPGLQILPVALSGQ